MKLLSIMVLLSNLISISASAKINCKAVKEVSVNQKLETETVDLVENKYGPELSIYRADLGLMHFSVTNENTGSYLLLITEGPDYLKGTAVRAGFDFKGKIKATIVRENTVYKLVCENGQD